MPNPNEDTQTLASFHQNAAELLHQLKTTHRPITLTVDGKPEAALQHFTEYQRLLDIAAATDAHEGIRQGLEQLRAGEGRPAADFLSEMRVKYALPR